MSNVTPIRRVPVLPPGCARALELMREARKLLDEAVTSGRVSEGSPPGETRWYLGDAIGMLTPSPEDQGD